MSLKNEAASKGRYSRIPKGSWSLALRLTVWYSVSAFCLIAIATGTLYWFLRNHLNSDADRFLTQKFQTIESILAQPGDPIPKLKEEIEIEPKYQDSNQFYARVVLSNGHIVAETPGMASEFPSLGVEIEMNNLLFQHFESRSIKSKTGKFSQYLSKELVGSPMIPIGAYAELALDRSDEVGLLEDYREGLLWVLLFSLIASSLMGYSVARKGMRPLNDIAKKTSQITSSTLHERINFEGLPEELSILAENFNEMLNRLENSFQRLSQFSADIAHELRTPLNNLRGEAEVGLSKKRTAQEYEEILGSCLEECLRLSGMVDSLFFLARAEDPVVRLERQSVPIKRELEKICEFYEPEGQRTSIQVETSLSDEFTFNLDRSLFQRAVANLVTNAFRYTENGSITVLAQMDHSSLIIEVKDNGVGIPQEHIPRLFERFYKVDTSRSSSSGSMGLGLSIVKGIMTLHGGLVEVQSKLHHGTTVRLIFPPEKTL